MPGVDARCAEPVAHRIEEQQLQRAPMDGDLRPAIARRQPARLLPDLLAERVEVAQLLRLHARRDQRIEQPESVNSRTACGSRLMPTPSARISATDS